MATQRLYSKLTNDGEVQHLWGLDPPDDGVLRWCADGARFYTESDLGGNHVWTPEVMRAYEDLVADALRRHAAANNGVY